MFVLVTCKNEEDPIKNKGTIEWSQDYSLIFQTLKGSLLPVRMKKFHPKMKALNSSFYVFHIDFRHLIFFIFSMLAKCDRNESCTGKLAPISPKGPKVVTQTDFVYMSLWRKQILCT